MPALTLRLDRLYMRGMWLPLRLQCLCGAAMEIARCDGHWLLGHIEGATPSTCLPLIVHADFAQVVATYAKFFHDKVSGRLWWEREQAAVAQSRSSCKADDVVVTLALPLSLEDALRLFQRSQPSTATRNEDSDG